MNKITRWFLNKKYKLFPPEMVSYWKTKESVEAKVTTAEDGHYIMWMDGEKYPFPGFPRGSILFSTVSKLKHEIKNQIFNTAWYALEDGKPKDEVIRDIKQKVLPEIQKLTEERRLLLLPPRRMVPAVREIWRAFEVVGEGNPKIQSLKETLCLILQEDDAYRFRVGWIVKFFNPSSLTWRMFGKNLIKTFDFALQMLEHGEVIDDMKERIRLLRRILLLVLEDEQIRGYFEAFCKEVDWNKVKLTEADKYFFRGKYFKVDYPEFEY
jgi:hypothetical protein